MRRSIMVLALVASLLGLSIPAFGHTNYGHSHTCGSDHGWDMDGLLARHAAYFVYVTGSGWKTLIVAQHRETNPQGGYTAWVTAHTHNLWC